MVSDCYLVGLCSTDALDAQVLQLEQSSGMNGAIQCEARHARLRGGSCCSPPC
jgi:hypothetical protein